MSVGVNAGNQWANFDLLDRPSSVQTPQKSQDLFEGFDKLNSKPQSGPQQPANQQQEHLFEGFENNDDLLDSFDLPHEQRLQEQPQWKVKDDIDDLFAVFDAPAVHPQSVESQPEPVRPVSDQPRPSNNDAYDEAIASLIDMGFTVEQSAFALKHTHTGLDVQQAVNYLMVKAHNQSSVRAGLPPQRMEPHLERSSTEEYFQVFSKYFSGATKKLLDAQKKFMSPPPSDGTPAWMREAEKYKSQSKFGDDPEEITSAELERLRLESQRKKRSQEPPQKPPRPERSSQAPQTPLRKHMEPEVDLFAPIPSRPEVRAQPQYEVDLFSNDTLPTSSKRRSNRSTPQATSTASSTSSSKRPQVYISATQLEFFKDSKEQGGEAFKNGDFTGALQHYETSLSSLPEGHVYQILAISNVITCLLKTGENKRILELSDKALMLIGDDKGTGEEIDGKSMKQFWIKILTKRAEALEHLEKYKDALDTWTLLITNGAASKQAMDGKRRCQDMLNPKPKQIPKQTPKQTPKQATPMQSTAPVSTSPGDAAQRIRETHKKEDQFEEDKYKLHDVVEQKLSSWRSGKEDNLRALLCNLDTILWPETQWKKVNMSDLVMPKKVKICYMKAVAKTHPDKISLSATSEQKMIAEGVFVTLNTAWEGFKQQNGIN
jgi:hypothetical protein